MRLLEADTLTNQNISSALLIGTYTAAKTHALLLRVFADQVAGNGDYVIYALVQRGGAGSEYRLVPITTAAVALGVTSIAFPTIILPVTSGDIVKVYLTGLAGDTTTPDTIVEFWDYSAWDDLLANYTISSSFGEFIQAIDTQDIGVTSISNSAITASSFAANSITETAIADNAITVMQIAAGAITSAKLADDAITAAKINVAVYAFIAAEVWANATRTLTSFGTLVADIAVAVWTYATRTLTSMSAIAGDVWSYASRTLTMTVAQIIATISGTAIIIRRGDDETISMTLGSMTGYITLDFMIKRDLDDADNDAVLWIRKNASGIDDGLLRLNGAAPTSAAWASITINTESTGAITISITHDATSVLRQMSNVPWDFQKIGAGDVIDTMSEGICNITLDIVRATS